MHEWKQTCEFVDQETTSLALVKVESLCHFIRLDAMKKAMNRECQVFGINSGTLLGRTHNHCPPSFVDLGIVNGGISKSCLQVISVNGLGATSSILSEPSVTIQVRLGSRSRGIHIYNTMFGEDRCVELSQGDRRRLRIGDVIVFCKDSAYCLVGVKNDTNITTTLQHTEPNMAAQGQYEVVPRPVASDSVITTESLPDGTVVEIGMCSLQRFLSDCW